MEKYIGHGKICGVDYGMPNMTEEKKVEYKNVIINQELPHYNNKREALIHYIKDRINTLNDCNDDPYMIDVCQCYIDVLNEYYPDNIIKGKTKTGETYQLNNHEKWILHCEEHSDFDFLYTYYSIKIDYTGSTRELNGVLSNNWVVTVKGDLQYI